MTPPARNLAHAAIAAMLLCLAAPAAAQIGGHTAEDGVFVLDDAEDLDLVANGVDRNWIPQFVWGGGLSAEPLDTLELTLAPGQSPVGTLLYRVPAEYGYINKSFGVPMPSVPGESTIPYPGNIADFQSLDFLISFTPVVNNQEFWVILETYPEVRENVFPRIMWKYEPEAGDTFQPISIPLHSPTLILDGEGYEVEELLSQTRFLSFYFYGESDSPQPVTLRAYIDDITLVPGEPPAGDAWILSGPTPTEQGPTSAGTEEEPG